VYRNGGRTRWRIDALIENREAAVGVQVLYLRQRWGAAIWRVLGVAALFAVLVEQLLMFIMSISSMADHILFL
jgi:hypothetical protein